MRIWHTHTCNGNTNWFLSHILGLTFYKTFTFTELGFAWKWKFSWADYHNWQVWKTKWNFSCPCGLCLVHNSLFRFRVQTTSLHPEWVGFQCQSNRTFHNCQLFGRIWHNNCRIFLYFLFYFLIWLFFVVVIDFVSFVIYSC